MRKLTITLLLALVFASLNINSANAFASKNKLNDITQNEIINFILENADDNDFLINNVRTINTKSKKFMKLDNFNKLALNNHLTLEESELDTKTRRFNIIYKYHDETNDLNNYNIKLSGVYNPSVDVPVLNVSKNRGSIIKESDITYIKLEKRRVRNNITTDIQDIVGKELTRSIRENTSISTRYLQKPQIVKKNDLITVLYQTKTIEIKTLGKAMESGGIEDVIKIKNLKSGSIIQAIITKKGNAIVNFKDFLINEDTTEDGIASMNKFRKVAG